MDKSSNKTINKTNMKGKQRNKQHEHQQQQQQYFTKINICIIINPTGRHKDTEEHILEAITIKNTDIHFNTMNEIVSYAGISF